MRIRTLLASVFVCLIALSGGVADAGLPLRTIVAFDPAAGEFPEGVAISKTDVAYVSLIGPVDEIRTIAPDGTQATLAHLAVPGFGPLGLAIGASGTVYVAVASFDPSTQGVYRVMPDGTTTRLPGTGGMAFPNGVALDKMGNIYATDSIAGAIWKIPRSGPAAIWAQDPLLQGTGDLGLGFPLGANGIAIRGRQVVVTNTEGARIVTIPVEPDGSAGPTRALAAGTGLLGADGVALDVHGNIYVAVNPQSTLVRVSPDGSISALAGSADGLNNPASLAFGTGRGDRQTLFITNFAVSSTSPTPALLAADVGVPGMPLP